MPNTFELIASSTVGAGGAANIDFTSIPSTYTDLVVKCSVRNSSTNGSYYVRFNGSTSSYTEIWLFGLASTTPTAQSITGTNIDLFSIRSTYTANTFSSTDIYIPNYTSSNNKSVNADNVQENNATESYLLLEGSRWANSAAINQITLVPASGNFVQYSTAYLYGVKNA